MPVYEFRCPSCGNTFERTRPVSKAGQGARCPADGKRANRVFGAAVIGVGATSGGGFDDLDDMGDGGMPDMSGMGGMGGMDGLDMGGDFDDDF